MVKKTAQRGRKLQLFGLLLGLWLPCLGWADASFIEVVPGYTDQPELEREYTYSDLRPPETPLITRTQAVPLQYTPKVFDRKLSREFKDRYERTFGDTHLEQAHRLPIMGSETRVSFRHLHRPEESLEKQQAFGEYMAMRLAEHHVDLYLKGSETGKAFHEMKERVENTQVRLGPSTRLKTRYLLLSQQLDVSFENPFANTRVLWSPSAQPYLVITRRARKTTTLRGQIDWGRAHYRLSASERVSSALTATLTGISRRRTEVPVEYVMVAGFSYKWR